MQTASSHPDLPSQTGRFPHHIFKPRPVRKLRLNCDLCQQPISHRATVCKGCKYTCHQHCQIKVIAACEPSVSDLQSQEEPDGGVPSSSHLRSPSLPRGSRSLERPAPRRLQRPTSLIMDIIYVTERIIILTFPDDTPPATYKSNLAQVAGMLKVKHKDKYIVFNVSERRSILRKLNPQVLELGWPSGLAPPLERLCALCKAADCWLQADPRHIVVIHAKGDKGRVGVVLAAYMHYSSICASADQALDRFAMRRVYEDKLAPALKPSQKRYVHYFSGLLSGAIKMNNNTLYLHQIIIHNIPGADIKGGCRPFLKIYTGLQPVYTTGVYLATSRSPRLILGLTPSVALRGDVLVVCYHKATDTSSRSPIFRLQFHTCTVDGDRCLLTFRREDLDLPTDSSSDKEVKVELQFSYNPENNRASHHDVMVPVENAQDSALVRWDSYETFNLAVEDDDEDELDHCGLEDDNKQSYTEGPVDGSLYATVAKKKPTTTADGLSDADGPHLSMDSGISSSSGPPQGSPSLTVTPSTDTAAKTSTTRRPPSRSEQAELDELLYGMLKEIQAIPDLPPEKSRPPLSRTSTLPTSFRQAYSPPPPVHTANGCANGSGTPEIGWLNSQQEKLRAKKEGKDWEDRLLKEQLMLAELKSRQSGNVTLELSPAKSPGCSTPLHINTLAAAGGPVSTSSPSGKEQPPPLIPSRSSSRDLKNRYQMWSPAHKPLGRQVSDNSWDRRSYSTVPRSSGLLATLDLNSSSPKTTEEDCGRSSVTPIATSPSFTKDISFLSDWSNGGISPERPLTPAFPVTPGTPYLNHESPFFRKYKPQISQREPSPEVPSPRGGQVSPSYLNHSHRSSVLSDHSDSSETSTPHFIKDTSKFWYKPNISREHAIEILKDKTPGSFIIRNSNSFPGAFGLALKVAVPPANIRSSPEDNGGCELVRHFLIEPHSKGVQLKGCANEPIFGSLSALVYQHSLMPISLPCKLVIPETDLVSNGMPPSLSDPSSPQAAASCNVLFLHTVDTESLTGPQAIRKALGVTLSLKPGPTATLVHFKVTPQGITLTDKQHKLFFRRHYPQANISHCGLDPDNRQWAVRDPETLASTSGRCFGFVARKPGSRTDNQCHLFVELDPSQPASAIVSFVAKTSLVLRSTPL